MKNILFVASFILIGYVLNAQTDGKKYRTFLELGLNSSVFEAKKNIDRDLVLGPNLGCALSYGRAYQINPKTNLDFGLGVSAKNLLIRTKVSDGFFVATHANLIASIKYKREITSKIVLGTGIDFDFLYSEDGGGGSSGLDIVNKAGGAFVFIPLVLSLDYNFKSKNDRKQALLFSAKKGFQVVDDYIVTMSNNWGDKSTFQFKNSSFYLAYRYYFSSK